MSPLFSIAEAMNFKRMTTVLISLTAAVLLAAAAYVLILQRNVFRSEIPEGEKPITNPMKGFMAWGENFREDPWTAFAYIPVYWDRLEPEEGIFDFEELEERCSFSKWKETGVRLVLRVVCDTPGKEAHMDIPEWLYEKMGEDGTRYDCDYGKGFSPNYENVIFKEAHARMVQALGERYADDPSVAYVQLGSLGHWGEWHVHTEAGIRPFPTERITDAYVRDYLEVFAPERILLRRPYGIGKEEGLGLYNDSFGQEGSHERWFSWIEDGYVSDQNGEALADMREFWKRAPSGGEFATDRELEAYFEAGQLEKTLEYVRQSHTTFLGPNAPAYDKTQDKEAVEKVLREMGYCLRIRNACLKQNPFTGKRRISLEWENSGVSPFYADWPVELSAVDENGKACWQQVFDGGLNAEPGIFSMEILPEKMEKLEKGSYRILAGILDPITKKPAVRLAMDTSEEDLRYEILRFRI